ncbi:hypothetical protein [Streptomyces sp. NBC_00258]|uniref:hypothetical protein n=1 Tax=Streptomyces sp. NBC_00258 TaxID=2903642 RepID=UPI002E2C8044|nr:hypothetical protein [Streptomyces sp. NBC_00258]
MGAKKKPDVEPEEPSRAAGACVLIVLVGVVTAVVFAVSRTAGPLFVWAAGTAAVWWHVRRVPEKSAPPPPVAGRPSCRKCKGQEPASVTPSETQKGMWIYGYDLAERPGHSHVHIAAEVNET